MYPKFSPRHSTSKRVLATAFAGVGLLMIVSAAPAQATPSTVYADCLVSSGLSVGPSSVTVSVNDTISIVTGGTPGGSPAASFSIQSMPSGFTSLPAGPLPKNQTFTVSVGAGAASGNIVVSSTGSFCPSQTAAIAVTVSGGVTPSPSPAQTTSSPLMTETLSLSVAASGATCAGGNPSGTSGSWLTLPGADQCSQSGPTAKPGAKLLGWATSANFPIARAQAQVDKKWGVIDEVIDGQRMIFIPGGMATFVSGSNNLFPIWSA